MKKNKIYRLYTLACLMLLCFCNVAIAQKKGIDINATVVDEQGNPMSGVAVFSHNGDKASSDVNGQFQINVNSDESVVVEKEGYESEIVYLSDLTGNIVMVKSLFLATDSDEIKMGVTTKDRREMTGAVSSINTEDRLTYDNTQWVRDYINGLMLGVRGSDNVRGLGSAIFVIDGVIGRDPNILNMEEVDQITVLKDANAVALYGSQARNGVIVINTKRGKVNKKEFKVNLRSTISTPRAMPNYLGSVKYMKLFNEARNNDGLDDFYEPTVINDFILSDNKYRNPDVDLYSDEYVESFVNNTSLITEFSGGSDKNQYYVNIGWNRSSAWVDINDDIDTGTNRFNVRGNIDFKINDWISSSLDGIAIISSSIASRANLLSAGTTFKPNSYSPFLPVDMIDYSNNPALEGQVNAANKFNGFLLGTSVSERLDAPVALAIAGGYNNTVFRSTQFNNSINFDLDMITEGLSAKTYLSFDFYDSYNLRVENEYRSYAPTWTDESITSFGTDPDNPTIYGIDRKDQTENVSTNGFVSRFGFYGLVNYDKTIADDHNINTTFLGYYNSTSRNNVIQSDIDSHFGLQVAYDFKKKLFVDFSASYIHSIKLAEGNRGGLSPTIGVGYILSEDSFLEDNNIINFLKLKASAGVIKSDMGIGEYYLYDSNYSEGNNFTWADGVSNRRQNVSQGENLDLGFEERVDLNIGFESYLLNSLWLEFNYFKSELDKQVTFLNDQYPSFYNTFRPYNNFNKNTYNGFEVGVDYRKSFNDVTISVGANVMYSQTEASKRSETNEFDYQNRVGKELSSIFGLVDQGFYSESDFDVDVEGNYTLKAGLPVPNFGAVQPGDLKYADQNNDNVIDNNDRVAIGQSSSPLSYGVNLNVNYKAFNLFILGTGQSGADGNKLNDSFNDYYGVNGNDKYSEVVLGRWTPETANTATFPRLSSLENQNNFRDSSFWIYDNSFFNINRAQLTYEFSDGLCEKIGMDGFSINLQGTNLLEISKNKDIRQLRIGSAPLTRSYTLGIRAAF